MKNYVAVNEREVLETMANDLYGCSFDELRAEEKDDIYCMAFDGDEIKWEEV